MNMNFKNFGNEPPGEGGRLQSNLSLARQTSIYSLTFDELQTTMGAPGKDFGSMNMDELLKSIWSAEETQTAGQPSNGGVQEGGGGVPNGGYLQRQGSLTLPRTLSRKTVDEVWRGLSKDYGGVDGVKDGCGVVVGSSNVSQTQRQPNLGEITLEEFFVRAGVVREDALSEAKISSDNNVLFGNFLQSGNNGGFEIGFQQNNGQNLGLMSGNRIADASTNQIAFQSANLPLNVNGVRSSQQQLPAPPPQLQPRQQQQQQQQQQLFPKQPPLSYATAIPIQSSAHLGSPGARNGMLGIDGMSNPGLNGNLVQNGALQGGGRGMVAAGAGAVTVAKGSPAVSSDGLGKSNRDTSSVSPIPYMFNGGLRGRKSSAVEKVVERRQRRMIKNRESAARSRARKQAYTMELEAEVAKLKDENEELRKKQEEIMEMQKNQVLETMDQQQGAKRRCLRRAQTGPW